MAPRVKTEPNASIHVKVPSSLFREVKLLLLDPRYGRVKYGEMSKLVTSLLKGWVDNQRKDHSEGKGDG